MRTVVFSPDDLTLVKGDPSDRRKFLDDLLMLRTPRLAGVRSDYDRVLKQRNSLLKTAGVRPRLVARRRDVHARDLGRPPRPRRRRDPRRPPRLVDDLRPYLGKAYEAVARGASRDDADIEYKPSFEPLDEAPHRARDARSRRCSTRSPRRRKDELDRGISLVGPHRDELLLSLGDPQLRLPVKGYASHGESWSFALALRLASYDLLRADGDDPILVLDDVFAELDAERRQQLAELVAGAEQVLVTAAVAADVPASLQGVRYLVADGQVTRDD